MTGILAFFGSLWTKISSYVIAIVFVALLALGTYFYWDHLENKIASLDVKNAELQSVINTQNATIKKLQQDLQKEQQDLNDLNNAYQKINSDIQTIEKNFTTGPINDKTKNQIEKQTNQTLNNIFQTVKQQTQTNTFKAGK